MAERLHNDFQFLFLLLSGQIALFQLLYQCFQRLDNISRLLLDIGIILSFRDGSIVPGIKIIVLIRPDIIHPNRRKRH